ncbi:MAG: LutC/YkgG family protein [Acidimicrobiia bacterium]
MTGAFLAAAAENGMGVYGPLAADVAVRTLVERVGTLAGMRRAAVPVADPLIEELGLRDALDSAGIELLAATDPAWPDDIGDAGVGVTGARAGIAATGTLLLPCGPGRPRGTHIIPPAHVCIVRAADLVATIADAMELQCGEPHPSTMSWVSGPSRTADLEMRQTIGVHGPRSVDVIVVG